MKKHSLILLLLIISMSYTWAQNTVSGKVTSQNNEELIGVKGIGTSGMDAQSVAHFVIVLFIFLGNLGYFIERKRSKKHQGS